jgi:hypothetical protein
MPAQQLRTIAVSPGGAANDVDFVVSSGGVITGRITNSDDAPVIEMMVELLPVGPQSSPSLSARPRGTWTSVRTDDRGIYRFYGVPPGRFRLVVGEVFSGFGTARGLPAYRRTFYPGTFEEAKATVVEINAGSVLTGVDLSWQYRNSLFRSAQKWLMRRLLPSVISLAIRKCFATEVNLRDSTGPLPMSGANARWTKFRPGTTPCRFQRLFTVVYQ